MSRAVGIKFEHNLKMYFFDAKCFDLHFGQKCVVETVLGMEMGDVVKKPFPFENIKTSLKPVIRPAQDIDILQLQSNREKERTGYEIANKKIQEHQLSMKLLRAHYTLDRGRLTFYFGSDERIDFRNLVKDLAAIFRTRIELRQMGVRDEAGMIGGCGMCGRELCCSTFLINFEPISIKMAKEQNLALNSAKISGVCGRLMCCLSFEYSQYKKLIYQLPKKGSKILTHQGLAKIIEIDIFKDLIRLELEDGKEICINEEEYNRFFL